MGYIVAYCTQKTKEQEPQDHWEFFQDHEDAILTYKELLDDSTTYVATICSVMESTDY